MLAILALTLLSTFVSTFAASRLIPIGASHNTTQRRDTGSYVQAAYYANWDIYGANFQPTDIDPSQLTHILYAFADVSSETGQVFLTDSWADEEKHFPGDSWDEPGNNLFGCLKQLYLLKLSHRHLKVLLSVGGWTYSQDGHFSFLSNSDYRGTFVASAIQLIKDYGFDGLDVDFEYPASKAEGQDFLALMTSLRNALDELAAANGDTTLYELTAAVSAGSAHYVHYPIAQLDLVLSYWNLMAYDYAGSWLTYVDEQDNLYGGSRTGVSTDAAIKYYVSSGATPGKISMGIPLYGRAFENTNGIGQPYSGIGPGTLEAGVYSYKDLPLPGAQVVEDLVNVASYSYDPVKRELVSYDIPGIVRIKAEYVKSTGLAGCMYWELSTDKAGAESLVQTVGTTLGQLDSTLNHIYYPHSKWDNIRDNMGELAVPSPTSASASSGPSSSSTSTSTPAPTPTPTSASASAPTSTSTPTPTSTSTPTPTSTSTPTSASTTATATATTSTEAPTPTGCTQQVSCLCDGVSPWSSTVAYVGHDEVVYDGHLWTAKWWTENNIPGGTANIWVDEGVCN